MTVLHVREQGATVRRDGERIRVTAPEKETRKARVVTQTPVREIEQVIVYGNVQVTTQAVALLLQHEVDLVFLSLFGSFRGRAARSGSKFARLRHAQLRLSGAERTALPVAKAIVRAKLANQRNTLTAMGTEPDLSPQTARALAAATRAIDAMRRKCARARSTDSLRGFEGNAGRAYFGALRTLLAPAWMFEGRKYYPPPDPFNALLSFGYALLQKDCTATLHLVGLDPFLGCFHAMEDGRPSLTLDMMEEFRPLAVDRVMLTLAHTGRITPDAFTYTNRPDRPVELGSDLIPLVIAAYEEQMSRTILHKPSGRKETLRRALELQARIFARVVTGERRTHEGLEA